MGRVLGDRGDFVSFGDSDFPFDTTILVLLVLCAEPDRDLALRGGDASTVATKSFEPVSLTVRSTHSAGAAAFPKVGVEVFVASLDIARARGTDPYQSQSVGGLRLITCRLGGFWGNTPHSTKLPQVGRADLGDNNPRSTVPTRHNLTPFKLALSVTVTVRAGRPGRRMRF